MYSRYKLDRFRKSINCNCVGNASSYTVLDDLPGSNTFVSVVTGKVIFALQFLIL